MTFEEESDDESHVRLTPHTGAVSIRPGSKSFPKLTKLLTGWHRLNEALNKVPYQSWERDPENHQIIVYMSEPGYHTTKVVGQLRKRVRELEGKK